MLDPKVFYNLSYGMYIVSTWDAAGGRPTGCVANSIMQITSTPATVAVSLNHNNYTRDCIQNSGRLAVSILSEGTDPELIRQFGFSSGRDRNKFEGVLYTMRDGLATVDDSCGWFSGKVIGNMDTATHMVFLVEVEDGEPLGSGPAMSYGYYHSVIKGKTAKNAPTYQAPPEPPKPAETGAGRWRCPVCGYVYQDELPFEELPADWVCPICCLPKAKFVKTEEE